MMEEHSNSKIVYLDVGGSQYTTSVDTLVKYPTSMLALMFSGRVPTTR